MSRPYGRTATVDGKEVYEDDGSSRALEIFNRTYNTSPLSFNKFSFNKRPFNDNLFLDLPCSSTFDAELNLVREISLGAATAVSSQRRGQTSP